jgi:hypothetical protein
MAPPFVQIAVEREILVPILSVIEFLMLLGELGFSNPLRGNWPAGVGYHYLSLV